MKPRKNAAGSSLVSSSNNSKATNSSSTRAAAVTVTKFGQVTFTSVRRREDHENGKFVPLKKTKYESDVYDQIKLEKPPVKVENKPKVYKFFKSRAAPDSSKTPERPSRSPPRPLVLNTLTPKSDGVKRITTSKTSKNDRNSATSSGLVTKTVNLQSNKSCEIKVCGDKTIKKIISPNKTTEFIIRNNSNVRNATVKPNMSSSAKILPSSRGIRSSRRLRGVEPESQETTAARNKASTAIHVVFDKEPIENETKLTTTIEIQPGSPPPTENFDDSEAADDVADQEEDTQQIEEKLEEETIEETNSNQDFTPIPSADDKVDDIVDSGKLIDNHVENHSDKPEENNMVAAVEKPEEIESKQTTEPEITTEKEASNQASNNDENRVEQSSQNDSQNSNVEAKVCGPRPKKKIFSNRDRNKVEFNTRSLFSSEMKDEFEMEIDTGSQSSGGTEKKTVENDEDETYIKLKRIKKAHQCHELGETEQFDEDIKYYLSGIISTNANSMRCLSILGLTQKTIRPEFRMHLRAHDDMPRIIKALMDAPKDSNLALCTACLMFVYNQDRLTMDIDPNALSLMLELLETRSDECNQVEERHRANVMSLVQEMKAKGHAQYLKLNEITAGKLAMETLLGLTSKRAGDWFKVELRKMKGIDFIVNAVIRCAEDHAEEGQMVKIDRCMHVLENVTFNNVENQEYITNYNESKFISTCISLLVECKKQIICSNDSKIYLSAFFSILRVLTNLTSESVDGCKIVGTLDGVIELLLESLFELPSFIMSDQRFDLMVIILCLCINLAEFCEHIRDIIMNSSKYMSKMCELLFKKIEEAAQVEQQTDHLLESHETVQMTEAMQDNLLMQMISKSGTHMEHSLLSAAVCLLFGCCVQNSEKYKDTLKDALPNQSFKPLIEQLEKLRDFAHLADIMTQKGKDRVQKVLQMFKSYNQATV